MPGSQPPFAEQTRRSGRLGRILGKPRPEDAMIEVNNLFARAVRVRSVTETAVQAVCARYGIELRRSFTTEREKLYRDYLHYCLSDHHLTEEELSDLEHLRQVLQLDPDTVAVVHRRVARQVYSRTVDEVLADAGVDDAERRFLAELQEHLEIPRGEAENILDVKTRQRVAKSRAGSRAAAQEERGS